MSTLRRGRIIMRDDMHLRVRERQKVWVSHYPRRATKTGDFSTLY